MHYFLHKKTNNSNNVLKISTFGNKRECERKYLAYICAILLVYICSRRSITRYTGGNITSWKSKKQNVVARSNVEAKYGSMALATCKLEWITKLLQEFKLCEVKEMKLYYDNQSILHIVSNLLFRERTKHGEIDCNFIKESYCY